MKKLAWFFALIIFSVSAVADDKPFKQFGNHKVFYSAFNSTFIQPDIADVYKITRGKDKGLVNIALVHGDTVGGQSAIVSGSVSNIFAQSQTLNFFEVREGDSVYYLAPFTFENEDFLTFKVNVKADANSPAYAISFQKTFYHEE